MVRDDDGETAQRRASRVGRCRQAATVRDDDGEMVVQDVADRTMRADDSGVRR